MDGKTVAFVEARMSSTRLPGKVLMELTGGRSMLQIILERTASSRLMDSVVVATTENPLDDPICDLCAHLGVPVFRGSEEDVLGRVLNAATHFSAEHVIRLTGDCPLIDPELIDDVIRFYREGAYDYVSTTHMDHSENWKAERTFPRGVTVQTLTRDRLMDVDRKSTDPRDREFVTFYIYDHPETYRLGAFQATGAYSAWRRPELRFAVDTSEDMELMRQVYGTLYPANPHFSTLEAIRLVAGDPALRRINAHVRQKMVYKA